MGIACLCAVYAMCEDLLLLPNGISADVTLNIPFGVYYFAYAHTQAYQSHYTVSVYRWIYGQM